MKSQVDNTIFVESVGAESRITLLTGKSVCESIAEIVHQNCVFSLPFKIPGPGMSAGNWTQHQTCQDPDDRNDAQEFNKRKCGRRFTFVEGCSHLKYLTRAD